MYCSIKSLYVVNYLLLSQASRNVDVLKDQEAVKQLGSILKTNVRACKALGHPFVVQLGRIYLDMLNVYKVNCSSVNHNVAKNQAGGHSSGHSKSMILNLPSSDRSFCFLSKKRTFRGSKIAILHKKPSNKKSRQIIHVQV